MELTSTSSRQTQSEPSPTMPLLHNCQPATQSCGLMPKRCRSFALSPESECLSRSIGRRQVEVVTKSGTNDFHGAAFWFHRPTRLSANDFNNRIGLASDLNSQQLRRRRRWSNCQERAFFSTATKRIAGNSDRCVANRSRPLWGRVWFVIPILRRPYCDYGRADATIFRR